MVQWHPVPVVKWINYLVNFTYKINYQTKIFWINYSRLKLGWQGVLEQMEQGQMKEYKHVLSEEKFVMKLFNR